ncbi:MAG TPA: flagellar motor switch protein FliN [Spirochaetia bacterium]|nr:MAG: flagellar motor switch protein FliN [Spirochaetes bacterium GWB1_36_13]HCL57179.1 flagellar motor switch protein FliN [Spirochaetia bacterium]
MGEGTVSQNEIDDIINSLTGGGFDDGGGGGSGDILGSESGSLDDLGLNNLTSSISTTSGKNSQPKKKEELDTENIPLLLDVKMKLSVVLGTSRKPIGDVIDIGKGSIVELDRYVEDDVDVYINDQLVGKGQIVVLDDEYGIKITKILNPVKKGKFIK